MSDAETMWLTASGDVVEVWSTDERGLEIRRHLPNGKMKVSSLAPLPRRTPHDHPLFNIAGVMERASGDLFLHWGEYLVLLPVNGPPGPTLRTAFKRAEIFQPALHTRPRRDLGRHRVGQALTRPCCRKPSSRLDDSALTSAIGCQPLDRVRLVERARAETGGNGAGIAGWGGMPIA
jgi:hypothetical protein